MHGHLLRTVFAAAISCFVALAARQPTERATKLHAAGATYPAPIYQKWFQSYRAAHPNVSFDYQAVGSGGGIAQYKAGAVDFAASDVPLSDAELAGMGRPTLQIPAVGAALVPVYNIDSIGKGLCLTGEILADIYLGKIKSWDDPRIKKINPTLHLPSQTITVVHRADGSGETYLFTAYLSSVSPEWRKRVGMSKSVRWPTGLGGSG